MFLRLVELYFEYSKNIVFIQYLILNKPKEMVANSKDSSF